MSTFTTSADSRRNSDADPQRRLWSAFHDSLKNTFEKRLLAYVDEMIVKNYPAYCTREGRVIDKRLANRIGVNRSMLSRARSSPDGAFSRLGHFLALLNLCGIHFSEVSFPPPQLAVLQGLRDVFPLAQKTCGQADTPPPGDEELLVLYFCFNLTSWRQAKLSGNRAQLTQAAQSVCELVATSDCDNGQSDSMRLVPNPRLTAVDDILDVDSRLGDTWRLLRDTFPFLRTTCSDPRLRRRVAPLEWGVF